MTTKSRSVVLDTNVVIELFRLGLWEVVCGGWCVHIAETVVDEAKYFDAGRNAQSAIDLAAEADAKRVMIVSASAAEIEAFARPLGLDILDKLDAGEAESLTWHAKQGPSVKICSADKIVWRVLGVRKCGEDGISLEEMLEALGRTARLEREFCRDYRERWTRAGFRAGL